MSPTTTPRCAFVLGGLLLAALLLPADPALAQCTPAAQLGCLTDTNVTDVVRGAAQAISTDTAVIAVTDRGGNVLGVFRKGGAAGACVPPAAANCVNVLGNLYDVNDVAVGLARTGSFFSNDQAPLSSRTVRMISGIHFPPGIQNKPNAALYGIENTNRGCSFNTAFNAGVPNIPRAVSINGMACNTPQDPTVPNGCGTGIMTGKADVFDSQPFVQNGGGVPIFKDGILAGGVGVSGVPLDQAEFAAFTGSVFPGANFGPVVPPPGRVVLDGITLPFVNNTLRPPGVGAGVFPGTGAFVVAATASPYGPEGPPGGNLVGTPNGYLIGPTASTTPAPAAGGLTAAEVNTIVSRSFNQAKRTRAAIRLPLGSQTAMVIAVGDLDGNLLAVFRMTDATIFSIDVAVAKSRNAVYFSRPQRVFADMTGVPLGTATTARTLSFGAQPLFPAGIDHSGPGPFFNTFLRDVRTPCSQAQDPANIANQSGIVFFPGSIGVYRNNTPTLIGGLGVSGDGVEQDDLVTAAGVTPNFVAPPDIRADRVVLGGVRLPFFKFPRNPEVQ